MDLLNMLRERGLLPDQVGFGNMIFSGSQILLHEIPFSSLGASVRRGTGAARIFKASRVTWGRRQEPEASGPFGDTR